MKSTPPKLQTEYPPGHSPARVPPLLSGGETVRFALAILLDGTTYALAIEIDGTDYILTL